MLKIMTRFIHLRGLSQLAAFVGTVIFTSSIFANPVLNNVSSGTATVQQTQNTTVVNQTSQRAVINWHSFNIGVNDSTHFQQPNGGVALNRISASQGPSQIYGRLTATGQIILVNPAGIYFGPSAYVNVGGLIAGTANITDQDFMSGNYKFTNATALAGSVINEGTIIAAQHGLVALIGSAVSNKGMIQADLGKVVLASGEAFTMSFAGNDMIHFSVDTPSNVRGRDQNGNELNDGVSNTGSIIANGGSVMVTARAASGVLNNVINLAGIVEVKSVSQKNGVLILSGDTNNGVVRVASRVDASGKQAGEKGGAIDITGYNILLTDGSLLDVSGDMGGGNINIGGNYQGNGPLPHANALVMAKDATILADAITSGNGGQVVLWSDYATKAYGRISAQGGAVSGNGGLVETSSVGYLDINGIRVDLRAASGKTGNWLLDPADLTICSACTTTAILTGDIFEPDGTNSNLLVDDLITQLASANITVQTTAAGVGGIGDIFVNVPIEYNSDNSLTFTAFNDVFVAGRINNDGSGDIVFNANTLHLSAIDGIRTAGADIVVNANVNALAANTLFTAGGNITFNGNINGANIVGVTAGDSIFFNGAIGGVTPLSRLSAASNNNIHINALSITTSGQQEYLIGNLVLGSNTNLTTSNNNITIDNGISTTGLAYDIQLDTGLGNIDFGGGGTASNLGNIVLNSSGTTTIDLSSISAASLTTDAAGSLSYINTLGTTTTGNIALNASAINILTDFNLTSSTGTITLNGPVEGTANIALNGAAGVNINGTIGSTFAADSLTITGATNLNGGLIRTTGAQTYNSAVLLGAATTLNTTNSNVLFNSTLNTVSGQDLTINAGIGNITFNDNIGAINFQPGVTNLNSTGITAFNGVVNFFTSLTTNAGGTTQINGGGILTASGNITIDDSLIVNNALNNMQSLSGGTITLNAVTGDGLGGLQVSAFGGGQIILNGAIAGATPLSEFTAQGPTTINTDTITTSGTQAYVGAVTLGNNLTMTGSSIGFNSAGVNGAFDLTLSASNVSMGSMGNLTPLSSLTINGNASSSGGTIATVGNILVNGSVFNINSNQTMTSSAGFIVLPSITSTFSSTAGITLNGNSGVTFGNNVGSVGTPLAFLTVNGATTITGIGGQIRTSGTQTYNSAVTLAQNVDMISTAGSIIFASTLNGGSALSLNGNAGVTFSDSVGNTSSFTSLTVTGPTNLNGGSIRTNGTQTYNGGITLGADTAMNANNSNIIFNGAVDSLNPDNFSLNLTTSGNVAFNAQVGGTRDLLSLVRNAGGDTTINTSLIRTRNNQFYGAAVLLTSDTTLSSTSGGGNISFLSTVDGAHQLTTTNSNVTTFSGSVGGTTPLASYIASAGGILQINGGSIVTTGAQTYNNTVNIGATTTLSGTDITFNSFLLSQVATNQALTLNDGGTTTFNAAVGGQPFSSITTDSAGSTAINTTNINATGNIQFNDNVILGVNTTVTSSAGEIIFDGNLNGAGFNLTVNHAGSLSRITGVFSGVNSAFTKLGSGLFTLPNANTYTGLTTVNGGTLIANNAQSLGTIDAGTIINAGTLNIAGVAISEGITMNAGTLAGSGVANLNGAVTFSSGIGKTISAFAGSNFTLNGTINGTGSLFTSGTGTINFNGEIGNLTPLTNVNMGTNTVINNSIRTLGAQTYSSPITLTAARNFTSSSSNITFNSTVDGAHDLVISAAGNITFASAVGSLTPLSSLVATSSNINMNGSAVTTTGNQTYNGLLNLGAATTTLTMTGSASSAININNGVSGNQNLALLGSGTSNDSFNLTGSIGVNDLTLNGGAGGNDSLSLNSGGAQTFTLIANNAGIITGVTGVTGTASFTNIQNLTGGSNSDNFVLNAGTTLGGAINGGSGTNSLALDDGTATWTVNGVNAGSLTNLGGGFSNIQNLIGGTGSDTFIIAGGSVVSINGGGGANSLSAANGANNTFNITGANAGSLSGYVTAFSNIQSLTGSTGANTFNFADNASISGLLNGGANTANNTLNYTAYTTGINVELGTLLGDIFDGTVTNHLSATISSFQNIGTINSNLAQTNTMTLPNKVNTLFVTDAAIGYINDPLFFNGFTQFTALGAGNIVNVTVPASINFTNNTVTINGVTMVFNNFTISGFTPPAPTNTSTVNPAQIVQQPTANSDANGPVATAPQWMTTGSVVNQDLNQMLNQITEDYETQLNQTRINPYCFAGS